MRRLIFIWLVFCQVSFAQDLRSSKTYVNTCYDKHQCFSLSEGSYIFYNTANTELYVLVDFNKFRTDNDSLDEWLSDLSDSKLVFKGYLGKENIMDLTHHNSKTMVINGLMTFDHITRAQSIEFTFFEIAQNGILFKNNEQDYLDRIHVNLQFSLMPKDFKIDKKPHHLKKVITVSIYRGIINQYKTEFNRLINAN